MADGKNSRWKKQPKEKTAEGKNSRWNKQPMEKTADRKKDWRRQYLSYFIIYMWFCGTRKNEPRKNDPLSGFRAPKVG